MGEARHGAWHDGGASRGMLKSDGAVRKDQSKRYGDGVLSKYHRSHVGALICLRAALEVISYLEG